jgi:hypothetical protein
VEIVTQYVADQRNAGTALRFLPMAEARGFLGAFPVSERL